MYRALPHAGPGVREALEAEIAGMLAAEREYEGRKRDRVRPFEEADAAAMLLCDMRDPSVVGKTKAETGALRVCFLCGAELPPRRQSWCSDECPRLWTENHEWSSASFGALKRDDRRCVRCGSTASPECNHIEPRVGRGYHPGCHNHLDRLETLCHACHVVETNRQRAERIA